VSASPSHEQLLRENQKLRKINEVLMRRVERSMDMQGNDFALFETAILLEGRVRERTAALEQALRDLQASHRALAETKVLAEQANQSKTRFLAAVSHDLLQPLNAARLFLSALGETDQAPKSRQLIENIEIAFESIEQLLGSLLDISKLDAGVTTAEVADVPLAAVLRPLAAEFRPLAEQKGLELRFVPSSAVVRTDPHLLSRILRNLLSNAIRYTLKGRVLLGVRRAGAGFAVEVGDTGVGIPPDKQREVFEEFKRLGNAPDGRDRGFGLGLAIVERMARLLGHRIEVRSVPGRGSRFLIHVPAGRLGRAPAARRPAAATRPTPMRSALVLVIENERAIQEGMQALLQGWGFEVLTEASADGAISALCASARRPDLVIADFHLDQGQRGTSAVRRLRATFGDQLPGLIITADRMPEAQREIQALGLPLLNKPVRPAQLRALMRHLLAPVGT
jgi:signal transduction histidine kinase/CheY-like chemotaxis protein